MENFHYYGRFKRDKSSVKQNNVRQKYPSLNIRLSEELLDKIKSLARELKQTESKVTRDILENFFLDRDKIEWEKEVAGL